MVFVGSVMCKWFSDEFFASISCDLCFLFAVLLGFLLSLYALRGTLFRYVNFAYLFPFVLFYFTRLFTICSVVFAKWLSFFLLNIVYVRDIQNMMFIVYFHPSIMAGCWFDRIVESSLLRVHTKKVHIDREIKEKRSKGGKNDTIHLNLNRLLVQQSECSHKMPVYLIAQLVLYQKRYKIQSRKPGSNTNQLQFYIHRKSER